MEERKFGKCDAIIIGILLFLIVAAFVFKALIFGEGGEKVTVSVDGKEIGSYSLTKDFEDTVETELGRNTFVIENGEAYMKEADCPDCLCIKQGRISRVGQTIVCLPHKLVLSVRGNADSSERASGNASDKDQGELTYDGVAK